MNVSVSCQIIVSKLYLCISVSTALFHSYVRSMTSSDNEALWCMCVCWREGEKDSESLVQGRGVKGDSDPNGARGRGGSTVVGRGWFLMAGLVLIEMSDLTKTGLTGQLNGSPWTERLPSTSHTLLSPLLSRPALPSFSFMSSLLLY